MQLTTTVAALRERTSGWRRAGERIALVPTMGNLHDGHLSLVRIARQEAGKVIVSIFVNPSQFAAGEDFADYPRTLEHDQRLLHEAGSDLLFSPEVGEVYPFGTDNSTTIAVPGISTDLCGSSRPGHFDGVTSVVTRLLTIVQPDVAVFGEKDYQQLQIIRRLVADMHLPLEVISGATQREKDGLAMSSRNACLTAEERQIAPQLYRALLDTGEALRSGDRRFAQLAQAGMNNLTRHGFEPVYYEIRHAGTLERAEQLNTELVVLAAVKLGGTRLIDNLVVTL